MKIGYGEYFYNDLGIVKSIAIIHLMIFLEEDTSKNITVISAQIQK